MDDLILSCPCGHRMKVNVFAVGMKGRCAKCGDDFVVQESNTAPMDAAQEEKENARQTEEGCVRCGKPFRGEWDTLETPNGKLCYRCSNLATEGVPERLKHAGHKADILISPEPEPDPSPTGPKRRSAPFEFDPQSPGFKRVLFAMAFGLIAITLYAFVTDDYTPPGERVSRARQMTNPGGAIAAEAPGFVTPLLIGWQIAAAILSTFLALYFLLMNTGRLPHDIFWKDVSYIAVIVLVMTAIDGAAYGMYVALLDFGISGIIWAAMVGIIAIFSQILILAHFLDFRMRDFVMLLFYFWLVDFIVGGVGVALIAGLAALVT